MSYSFGENEQNEKIANGIARGETKGCRSIRGIFSGGKYVGDRNGAGPEGIKNHTSTFHRELRVVSQLADRAHNYPFPWGCGEC